MISDDRNSWKDGKFGPETCRKADVQEVLRVKKTASVPKNGPSQVSAQILTFLFAILDYRSSIGLYFAFVCGFCTTAYPCLLILFFYFC